MARAPTTTHLYGQPDNEYEVFLPFAETLVKTPHRSGHKLHITVSLQHHQQLARVILPTLRLLYTHHKVILPNFYANYGSGPLAGKFITVYAGPPQAAQRIIETIDPVLARLRQQDRVQPGPTPTNRQTGHADPEEFVGNSGMITWLWLDNLRRD
jgi:hypothetical protein